jgi:hypothetical protein
MHQYSYIRLCEVHNCLKKKYFFINFAAIVGAVPAPPPPQAAPVYREIDEPTPVAGAGHSD